MFSTEIQRNWSDRENLNLLYEDLITVLAFYHNTNFTTKEGPKLLQHQNQNYYKPASCDRPEAAQQNNLKDEESLKPSGKQMNKQKFIKLCRHKLLPTKVKIFTPTNTITPRSPKSTETFLASTTQLEMQWEQLKAAEEFCQQQRERVSSC
jgi:hypothetical protein